MTRTQKGITQGIIIALPVFIPLAIATIILLPYNEAVQAFSNSFKTIIVLSVMNIVAWKIVF